MHFLTLAAVAALVGLDQCAPLTEKRAPSKGDDILIVGAGLSGIHMAYELRKRGFENVEIIEAKDRIGGKINGGPGPFNSVDTGALLLTPDYNHLLGLMAEFNVSVDSSLSRFDARLLRSHAPDTPQSYDSFFFDQARGYASGKDHKIPTDHRIKSKILKCLDRYEADWDRAMKPYLDENIHFPNREYSC
jgi:cation diffusion facilitator CzcD-associated flavoprotein CzcO